MARECRPERIDLRRRDLEARRRPMTPEAQQPVRARGQPGVEVVRGDAAARSAPTVTVEGDQDAGAVVTLDQAGRDDADDAGVPALSRKYVRRGLRLLGTRGLGGEEDARLHVLALAVEQIELVGYPLGARAGSSVSTSSSAASARASRPRR